MPFTQNISKTENHEIDEIELCARLEKFLNDFGITSYKLLVIDSDASKRRYYRILTFDKSYIVMDAKEELSTLAPFLNMAHLLIKKGLKAPQIHASNIEEGLLLLEDLGDDSFTKFLKINPDKEFELYSLAIDVLLRLHKSEDYDISLNVQDNKLLHEGLSIFSEFYLPQKLDSKKSFNASKEIINAFSKNFKFLKEFKLTLTLRDYHADNLHWIPQNTGLNKIGILDFQDAVLGVPCYDLVSLLEDARRDVNQEVVNACKKKYFQALKYMSASDLELAYSILGAQRNLRIIGVFHKLYQKYNKTKYQKYLPRVWKYVKNNLQHPQLIDLKDIFSHYGLYEF